MRFKNKAQVTKAVTEFNADDKHLRKITSWGPRRGTFSGTHYSFDPISLEARSYAWWSMLTVKRGKLIRNTYNYSNQTAKDQGRLWRQCCALKIRFDLEIQCPAGLQSENWAESALNRHSQLLAEAELREKHARKPSSWVRAWIKSHKLKIAKLASFGRLSRATISKAYRDAVKQAHEDRARRNTRAKQRREAIRAKEVARAVSLQADNSL